MAEQVKITRKIDPTLDAFWVGHRCQKQQVPKCPAVSCYDYDWMNKTCRHVALLLILLTFLTGSLVLTIMNHQLTDDTNNQ